MVSIEIDPIVLVKLKSAFPKPAGAAEKAFKKFEVVLADVFYKCIHRGRDSYDTLFSLYSIPANELNQKSPQIGPNKIRRNKWLNDNGLVLIKKVEEGSNLTGLVSKVKYTEFMSIKTGTTQFTKKIASVTTDAELDTLLRGDAKKNAELFSQLYPDYFSYVSKASRDEVFDTVPVDLDSLKNYIVWLCTDAKHLSLGRLETYPDLYFSDLLSSGKRPSKSKAVAYMYQQSETLVMDVARATLVKLGIKTVANIHDAFIVRKKLSFNVREEVCLDMQDATQNRYWRFKAEQLEGFN